MAKIPAASSAMNGHFAPVKGSHNPHCQSTWYVLRDVLDVRTLADKYCKQSVTTYSFLLRLYLADDSAPNSLRGSSPLTDWFSVTELQFTGTQS